MEENSEAVLTDVSSSQGTQAYDVNISVSFFFFTWYPLPSRTPITKRRVVGRIRFQQHHTFSKVKSER